MSSCTASTRCERPPTSRAPQLAHSVVVTALLLSEQPGPLHAIARRRRGCLMSAFVLDRPGQAWFDVQLMHGNGDVTAEPPRRGRPRSEKARVAILEAAAELLLARGLSAVSMDAVAERAGVSKATIYRWWPTKETLALDALYTEWAAAGPHPRDTGSLRRALLCLL